MMIRIAALGMTTMIFVAGVGCTTVQPGKTIRSEPQIVPLGDGGGRLVVYGDPLDRHGSATHRSWLERILYGPSITSRPRLRNPQGMAYRNGRLFVCDQGLPDIVVVDLATGSLKRWTRAAGTHKWDWSRPTGGRPVCPVDVTVDEAGRVFVADTTRRAVLEYDVDGRLVAELRPPSTTRETFRPTAVLAAGATLYVCDAYAGCVQRYDPASGHWGTPLSATKSGGSGAATHQWDLSPSMAVPTGIARSAEGVLLVADAVRAVVHCMDEEGTPREPVGSRGRGAGQFVRPVQVGTTASGEYLFVVDAARQSVVILRADGTPLAEFPPRDNGNDSWRLTLPCGVLVLSPPESHALLSAMGYGGSDLSDEVVLVTDALGARSLYVLGWTSPQVGLDPTGGETGRGEP